jgi:Fur family ferric uptake transcriptional regulator
MRWQHRLRGQCARWTAPREAVVGLLGGHPGHWSAKDIFASLSASYPGIGMATIYRTLDLLERTGAIQKITLGDGQARYEIRSPDTSDHHHHLVCTGCGRIIDYSDFVKEELELVRKTETALAKRHRFRIDGHRIEFLGLCEKCRAAKSDPSPGKEE